MPIAGQNLYPYMRLGPRGGGNGDFLTVCVIGAGVGVDYVLEQKKLEARKMHENGSESHQSSARCVRRGYINQ
jgi:hypothetical protein